MHSPGTNEQKPQLLLLASLMPFPARANGFALRYAPILRALRATHEIHVALVSDAPITNEELAQLRAVVSRVEVHVRSHVRSPLWKRLFVRAFSLVPRTIPYPVVISDATQIGSFLRASFDDRTYQVLLNTSPEYTDILLGALRAQRVVIDAIDAMTLLVRRAAGRSLLGRYDAWRMRGWERRLASRVDYVSYIAHNDRRAVHGDTADRANVGVIPNGLYLDDYESADGTERDAHHIVFLGHMGYAPNINAARRLAALMPRIRAQVPTATLAIVGRSPTSEVTALANTDGVSVTGTVPSIWPHLHRAAVCCFPMTEGAGQQNKVLDAMWASCAVVTNALGNSGIGARDGEQVLLAHTDDACVEAVVRLLTDPQETARLAQAGRKFVEEQFGWERSLALVRTHLLGER